MSSRQLLILGASGHGRVAGDCAAEAGFWAEISYLDDRWPTLSACGPWQVIGAWEAVLAQTNTHAFVAVGNTNTRLAWLRRLTAENVPVTTIIHPRAVVSSHAVIGEGTLVVAGAVVNIGASIGMGCIINTDATVDHDCVLAEGVHVCPGAHLGGDVHVGAGSWIGIGSSIRHGVRIGVGVTVGAGAAVVADVPDGLVVVGVPARPMKKPRCAKLKC